MQQWQQHASGRLVYFIFKGGAAFEFGTNSKVNSDVMEGKHIVARAKIINVGSVIPSMWSPAPGH
jgi:hypothetical protein